MVQVVKRPIGKRFQDGGQNQVCQTPQYKKIRKLEKVNRQKLKI